MTDVQKLTPTTKDQMRSFPLIQPGGMLGMNPVNLAKMIQDRDPLKPEKVAIVGTAPSSRMLAPYGDPEWTIWGSSPGNTGVSQIPRIDAWFEMHCNFLWPENKHYGEPYLQWLNAQSFPVVAQNQLLIPRAKTYPLKRILKKFGPYFFTSTFSWMMAYAIDIGVKEMGLWGVDMASKDEYILQRAGGQYFIQLARNQGINVFIPPESDLAQHPPLYGYVDGTTFGRKLAMRRVELISRINDAQNAANQSAGALTYLRGALEDLEYQAAVWGSQGDPSLLGLNVPNDEEENDHGDIRAVQSQLSG
jgi:hypothetical protein